MELGNNGRQKQKRGEATVGMMEKQTYFKAKQSVGRHGTSRGHVMRWVKSDS